MSARRNVIPLPAKLGHVLTESGDCVVGCERCIQLGWTVRKVEPPLEQPDVPSLAKARLLAFGGAVLVIGGTVAIAWLIVQAIKAAQ